MVSLTQLSPELTFSAAFEIWIGNRTLRTRTANTRARYISERTEWDYRQYSRALAKFFGELALSQIHDGHFQEYHRARAECDGPWDRPCGPNRIRKEIAMLITIMKLAGAWTSELEKFFEPLQPVENDVPRCMDPDQQEHFLSVAASRAEWSLVHWYSISALQTTAATNEMRGFHIADIVLHQRIVQVRSSSAKNKYRLRSIPLETEEVLWAFEMLLERARSFGSGAPHHHLLPLRVKPGTYDPLREMSDSGLRKQWDQVRLAAGIKWLRPYDLRHCGITRMAEAGVPMPIILSYAGHISRKMQEHYTSISMASKRRWASVVWATKKPPVSSTTTPVDKKVLTTSQTMLQTG